MPHSVTSRFSIFSPRLGADNLTQRFPWPVVEASSPDEKRIPGYFTVFDLGAGQHDRVDNHLAAVRHILLAHERDLDPLCEGDCKYALWVYYEFPATEGAFNIHPLIHAVFAMFRVEVVFHLKPIT